MKMTDEDKKKLESATFYGIPIKITDEGPEADELAVQLISWDEAEFRRLLNAQPPQQSEGM